MKLTIELEDTKFCDGCPCLDNNYINHIDTDYGKCWVCNVYVDLFLKENSYGYIVRPKKCIKDNGK